MKMKKFREEYEDASSSFSHLPDEILLQILNKLIDLKTLCFCYLVSKRFSVIVLQVDAISFTPPLKTLPIPDTNTVGNVPPSRSVPPVFSSINSESFVYTLAFLMKFKGLKSLCIELQSPREIGNDNCRLFKWMVNFSSRIESFMFLSPNAIFDMDGVCVNGNGDDDDDEYYNEVIERISKPSFDMSLQCVEDAVVRHMMLLCYVKDLPMLEKVSITDSGRRGRLSLSGENLSELKKWLHSASESELRPLKAPEIVSFGYIPIVKLPVSGYVMKGIYFGVMEMKDVKGGYYGLMKSEEDGFEDKEEAAYIEAVNEILVNHKRLMSTIVNGESVMVDGLW